MFGNIFQLKKWGKRKKKTPIYFDCCLQNVQATKDKIDSNNVLVMTRVFRKFKQVLLLKNHHLRD